MEENIKVKIGDLIKLDDGTIVVCNEPSKKVACCDLCYFNNRGYNCARICDLDIRMHFQEVEKIHTLKDFKPNRLK